MVTKEINNKFPDENDLVNRFKAGDSKAHTELYDQMYKPLCVYTNSLIQDRQQSQHIVSETFEKIWKIHSNFNEMPSIKAFLYRVCYREGCDFLKYRNKKKTLHIDTLSDLQFTAAEEEDILARMVRVELIHHIFQEIKKLPPVRQKVLQLFYKEGLTTKEIAQKLEMEESAVRTAKSEGLAQLRKLLGTSINQHQLVMLLLIGLECQQEAKVTLSHLIV